MEAEDHRHDTLFVRKADEPAQPALPPVVRPIDKAREDRDTERKKDAVRDRRAKALELAVQWWPQRPITDTGSLLDLADDFVKYVETGERPA